MMNGVHLQARQSSLQRACPGFIGTHLGLPGITSDRVDLVANQACAVRPP